jgi:ribosomal protein S18 acetylase RimI-like enzyme
MKVEPVPPDPDVFVRPARHDDVGFLTDVVIVVTRAQGRLPDDFDEAVYRVGFADWTVEQVEGRIPDSATSVVEIHGERAGRLRVVRTPDHLELAGIQLLPAHQGQGHGTYLVEQLLVEAGRGGLPVRLAVEKDNPRARAFYERMGFGSVGETDDDTLMEWSAP